MFFKEALIGGIIIGLSVSWMLLSLGRVTGISGIINTAMNSLIKLDLKEFGWRILFILGLIVGGFFLKEFFPQAFGENNISYLRLAIAGWLVGFGTIYGSGCTSGHGICGLSRLSIRSLVATILFMVSGILTVAIMY